MKSSATSGQMAFDKIQVIKSAKQFQKKRSNTTAEIVPYHGFCSPSLYATLIYLSTLLMAFYTLTTGSAWTTYGVYVPKQKSLGAIFYLCLSSSGRLLSSGILFVAVIKRYNAWIPLYFVLTWISLGLFIYGMSFLGSWLGFSGLVLLVADVLTMYLLSAFLKDSQLYESMEQERVRRRNMIHHFADETDQQIFSEPDSKESFRSKQSKSEHTMEGHKIIAQH